MEISIQWKKLVLVSVITVAALAAYVTPFNGLNTANAILEQHISQFNPNCEGKDCVNHGTNGAAVIDEDVDQDIDQSNERCSGGTCTNFGNNFVLTFGGNNDGNNDQDIDQSDNGCEGTCDDSASNTIAPFEDSEEADTSDDNESSEEIENGEDDTE